MNQCFCILFIILILVTEKKLFICKCYKNKFVNQEIFQSYLKKMELFALKQLEAHEINKDLAILYEEFFLS